MSTTHLSGGHMHVEERQANPEEARCVDKLQGADVLVFLVSGPVPGPLVLGKPPDLAVGVPEVHARREERRVHLWEMSEVSAILWDLLKI